MVDLSGVKLERCLDCGKCTAICPVARYNHTLSPRRLVRRGLAGRLDGDREAVWACLTCMRCDTVCPQEVTISRLLPRLREQVRADGGAPPHSRCGAMDAIADLQSRAPLAQNRLDWLPDDVRTDPRSKTLVWVGCAPYFDAFYAENGVATLDAVIATVRILNALDIAPAVRAEERCCGHDALWGGDDAAFERLAQMNLEWLEEAAPERIVTACPECALTLDREYRERFGLPAGEVLHVAQLVADRAGELPLSASEQALVFSDPCRLGRHRGLYDPPRDALGALPGVRLHELPRNRQRATCCAGSWLSCNQATKRIQTDLLQDAAATGAETLVTACPKCLIHLKCAQRGGNADGPGIEIRDLAAVVASAITGGAAVSPRAANAEERG
jgi:Fe-S oxidoreductase